jgi:hypothetical protein
MELEFSRQIFEKYKYQISWKLVQWEPRYSLRTDRQTDGQTDERTDMKKANSRFWEFCERGKKKVLSELTPTP